MELEECWFYLEGDKVYFRGFDAGKKVDQYAVPLFLSWIAGTAANYLSTPSRKVRYSAVEDVFYVICEGKKKALPSYLVEDNGKTLALYEFGGWRWVKVDK